MMFKKYLCNKVPVCLLNQLKQYTVSVFAIFIFVPAFAQNTVQVVLQQQFDTHRQNNLQEKIYVHSDKNFYLAGEICWFKIYNVDGFFNKPLGLSKTAYVEILDKNNTAVLQAKAALKEGNGEGSFFLPASINSGKYKLRAYTNWMKNFSANYFFEKTITVINSRKPYEADTLQQKTSYEITFFPEGGNLVNGITSTIAFRVVNQNGKGVACQAAVINDKNDTIVKCATLKFGIGNFVLTPETAHSYKAIITLPDGKKTIQPIPAAYNNGYVMHLTAIDTGKIKIAIQAPPYNSLSSAIYLFVHTRQSVKLVLSGSIKNGTAEFIIDKKKLGDGISHFTVFSGERQAVCERLFFKYPEQKLQLSMAADKQEYEIRKKINIHIASADQTFNAIKANMSMAVYRTDSLQTIDGTDISNYLWLSSDLAGRVESPEYYFNNNTPDIAEAMDNLMLTHGWSRFRWEDILENKKPAFEFVPEYTGHLVTGKIINTVTGLPEKSIPGFLSVMNTHKNAYAATSNSEGKIKFETRDFYNDGEIIVQTNSQQDSLYKVDIANPFAEKFSSNIFTGQGLPKINTAALLKHNFDVQVQQTYNGIKLNQFTMPVTDTAPFYFKSDETYLLDNYVHFTTMEEVLREYVASVNVRKTNGRFHLPVLDMLGKKVFETDPMLLLDGVHIFDINKLMTYDPLKIKKLDVVAREYYIGNMYFDGIVNFTTYDGNLPGFELDPHATVIDYEGMQLQRDFFSPVYEIQEQIDSRLPDYRYLLYWSPNVNTNTNGTTEVSFYTSDVPGKYAAVLQGITADGKTGSKIIQFEVKPPAGTIKN
jgi:hypothetical protein